LTILKVGVTIHKDGDWYVAIDPITGVASQGKNINEALKNFQEAFELWFENAEPWERERTIKGGHPIRIHLKPQEITIKTVEFLS